MKVFAGKPALMGISVALSVLVAGATAASQRGGMADSDPELPLILDRGWEISPGAALDVSDLGPRTWFDVVVPGAWSASGFDTPDGHAWYRHRVVIPAGLEGSDLAIRLSSIHDIDRVFLNGHQIGATGTLPPDPLSAALYPRVYRLPKEVIRYASTNELMIHVFSSTPYGGLVGDPPKIDLYEVLRSRRVLASHALIGFSVLFVMVGINHLLLFMLGLPSGRSNLLFSFFAFASSAYALTFSTEVGLGFIGLETATRMNGALLPLCVMLMCAFLFSFFERTAPLLVVVQLLVLAGVAAVAIIAPWVIDPWIYLIVGVSAVFVAGSVAWMLADSVRRRRPFARPISVAVTLIGLGGLADLLSAMGLVRSFPLNVGGLVFPVAFVPFYVVMAGIFIFGYWRSYRESTIDALTTLMQRHYFLLRLQDELARAARSKQVMTVAMIDLDDFKSVNDSLSHTVGDRVLRATALAVKGATRQVDLVGRYGGDELCLAMSTPREGEALAVLERVRASVESQRIAVGDDEVGLTISLGAVICGDCHPKMSHTRLIELADAAVYRAKNEGGNRVAVTRVATMGETESGSDVKLDLAVG